MAFTIKVALVASTRNRWQQDRKTGEWVKENEWLSKPVTALAGWLAGRPSAQVYLCKYS